MIFHCCFRYHKGTDFQANHNMSYLEYLELCVVLDTTKVQIFKQITTGMNLLNNAGQLFQIPQRYRFSSKSQHTFRSQLCLFVVLDTTKVQIFKQITTMWLNYFVIALLFQIPQRYRFSSKSQPDTIQPINPVSCFRYHKGTDFQANHNRILQSVLLVSVVLDTTKVQIFKQITTSRCYEVRFWRCFRYHKGTDFQANHNCLGRPCLWSVVVLDTTKVQIFKQITTDKDRNFSVWQLFQIPQRYRFSSKSQPSITDIIGARCCFRYHKGTDFQANHNHILV